MEREAAKASRAAKKMRLDMRRRGHVRATRKGEDPASDQKEKQLNRLATKGVVLLFNAVAKAQKQRQEAAGSTVAGAKAARLSKASFLAQLKGSAAPSVGGVEGSDTAGKSVLGLTGRRGKAAAFEAAEAPTGAPGWRVLHDGFTGLPGGRGLKASYGIGAGGDKVLCQLRFSFRIACVFWA